MKYILTMLLIVAAIDATKPMVVTRSFEICVEDTFDPQTLKGEEALRYVFDNSEFKYLTEMIVAQAKFESYNFKSNFYINDHNFVGMGVAYTRPQNRSGINQKGERGRPTAIFASDYDCAIDLLSWYQWHSDTFYGIENTQQFVTKLRSKYYFGAPITVYLKGVERWLNDQPEKAYWLDDIS